MNAIIKVLRDRSYKCAAFTCSKLPVDRVVVVLNCIVGISPCPSGRWSYCKFDFKIIWPASREKGPSDITNSVDPDQPLHDIENSYTYPIVYTARKYVPLMWRVSKGADPDQMLRRKRGGWSGSTLFAYVPKSLFAWRWPYSIFNSLSAFKSVVWDYFHILLNISFKKIKKIIHQN